MGKKEIRIPSFEGIAGHCFHSGETLNIPDVYKDQHFLKTVDSLPGISPKVFCACPSGQIRTNAGCCRTDQQNGGQSFTHDDVTFLRTFSNHAAVFIEMAQLQKERIDALKRSQEELERLSRAKSKALDHLAHELRTPISLMLGTIKILKGRLARHYPEFKAEVFFEIMEKNLVRISDTQQETDKIVRTSLDAESRLIVDEFDHLWRHIESVSEFTDEIKGMFQAIREWIVRFVPSGSTTLR